MSTRVFTIGPEEFRPEDLDEPARILAEGGLVAFPTETVYGIGADRDRAEAIARLDALKERADEKHYSVHIADAGQVVAHVPAVPEVARRLMELYWPGPLTLILPAERGTVGFRLPSHPIARELVRRSGVTVVAPSANPGGQEPALDAAGVLAYFEGRIDAVVDGGPVAIREASTVVQVEADGEFHVLREGIITARMIRRAIHGKHILFVCTGNSCRSPMAMALARRLVADRLGVTIDQLASRGIHIGSAGVAAFGGGPASSNAVVAMAERGIELRDHRSNPVSRELIDEADLIIALGHGHRDQLMHWDPTLADRIVVISETGVGDPIGGDLETYRRCALEIERELETRWVDRILEP